MYVTDLLIILKKGIFLVLENMENISLWELLRKARKVIMLLGVISILIINAFYVII